MLVLRSALFNVLFYALLIVMMLLGLPVLLMGRSAVIRLSNLWGQASLALLRVVCGTRIVFRGVDNIPDQACIVAAKHQSFVEIIALVGRFPDYTFVLKRELTRIPVFGWYLARTGQIAIDRARGRAVMAQLAVDTKAVLSQGRRVFIFPEGTRRPPGAPADYRSGASVLYAETRAPCLPLALNSGLFWPRRSFLRRPGTIVLEFLPVIPAGLERTVFQARLRETIEAASNALMAEAVAADPRLAPLLQTPAVAIG